jgi:hypothetical protein
MMWIIHARRNLSMSHFSFSVSNMDDRMTPIRVARPMMMDATIDEQNRLA